MINEYQIILFAFFKSEKDIGWENHRYRWFSTSPIIQNSLLLENTKAGENLQLHSLNYKKCY